MTIQDDHHAKRQQRKLDQLADDLRIEKICVRLRYTDFGVEVTGKDLADVLLAKKELRNRRIEVAK